MISSKQCLYITKNKSHLKNKNLFFSARFFTEEDCLSQCKDAQRTSSSSKGADKTNNCESSAPICEKGCTLTKDNEGACLKCNCKKGKSIVNNKYHIHVLL